MPRSFHNKILRVNLSDATIKVEEPGVAYLRRYMGGWNIIADVLLREVPAGADPLGPANKLVFAPGVVTGLPISGASRNAVGAKSPLTGGFGAGEAGAAFGAELKRAGFDALIVEGVSPTPVYLWIKDGVCEIRDASHLWGKDTKTTWETLKTELNDKRLHCAMIGPGGENMVRVACIMNGLFDAVGRTGMGAVMGSKKLKAVAAHGTKGLESFDELKIRELARYMAQGINAGQKNPSMHKYGTGVGMEAATLMGNLPVRNFRDGDFEGAATISAENFMESELGDGMEGCFACAMRCKKLVKGEGIDREYGGPEYESFAALGSNCGVDDIRKISIATQKCNAYGLDTIGAGMVISFAMECFENGLLTPEDTGGIDLRFGNADAVIQMVEMIAKREGLGDLLAEGTQRASKKIPGSEMFVVTVKGQEYPMHEPRLKRGLGIGYAISPTGADHVHSIHDTLATGADSDGLQAMELARQLGIVEPLPVEDLSPRKARLTLYKQQNTIADNCISFCIFVPWTVEEKAAIVRAATGWDVTSYELHKVGERAQNLARVFNAREGFGIDDDRLAERSYGPTTVGALKDGGIDREELRETIETLYEMAGWDENGAPTPARLAELDVAWAAEYLPKK